MLLPPDERYGAGRFCRPPASRPDAGGTVAPGEVPSQRQGLETLTRMTETIDHHPARQSAAATLLPSQSPTCVIGRSPAGRPVLSGIGRARWPMLARLKANPSGHAISNCPSRRGLNGRGRWEEEPGPIGTRRALERGRKNQALMASSSRIRRQFEPHLGPDWAPHTIVPASKASITAACNWGLLTTGATFRWRRFGSDHAIHRPPTPVLYVHAAGGGGRAGRAPVL